jgi:GntR family histidine utilization transcriptional repressor
MKNKPDVKARFLQIKLSLLEKIELKELQIGDKVPSENQLAESFGVSRMTARRALSELVTEGVLVRSQGIGTFVADSSSVNAVIDLPNIDEQINQRQGLYTTVVLGNTSIRANQQQSIWMGVAQNAQLYSLKVVHKENGVALQLEDMLVNPALVPDFNEQNFDDKNSIHYLDKIAPFANIQHSIEAILPNAKLASVLGIPENQACIKICRKIHSNNGVVSYARLYHAGNRFRIGDSLEGTSAGS